MLVLTGGDTGKQVVVTLWNTLEGKKRTGATDLSVRSAGHAFTLPAYSAVIVAVTDVVVVAVDVAALLVQRTTSLRFPC